MSAIVRQAGRRSFWVLILSGWLSVAGWALYLPGWIDADRFVAGLNFSLAVLGGGLTGVWLYAAAAACLPGGPRAVEARSLYTSSSHADCAPWDEDTPSATSPSRDRRGGRSQTSGTEPGESASSPTH